MRSDANKIALRAIRNMVGIRVRLRERAQSFVWIGDFSYDLTHMLLRHT